MISGIGIDIVEIPRIRRMIEQWGAQFLDKVFTEEEQRYCLSRPDPAQHFAARFAAKEAFSKAIGTGWNLGWRWREVEIARQESGGAGLKLSGRTAVRFGTSSIHLSLSHAGDFAIAMVVLENPR
jgi:holo-[acyl-carrier protein] synthase